MSATPPRPTPPHPRYPSLHRPYRIPMGIWGCIAMLTPACLLLTGLLVVPWSKVCSCVAGMGCGVRLAWAGRMAWAGYLGFGARWLAGWLAGRMAGAGGLG